jgi:uncharacterized membrane protein HdeD (DUF308 family)
MFYKSIDLLKELSIKELKTERLLLITFGFIGMILGIICLRNPLISSITLSIAVGIMFIISGLLNLIERLIYAKLYNYWSILLGVLLGVLYIYLGYQFIKYPEIGLIALTYLIGLGFLTAGILRLILVFYIKTSNKIFFIFTAVVEILLALFLILSWPSNSILLTSAFLGLELIFNSINSFAACYQLQKVIDIKR